LNLSRKEKKEFRKLAKLFEFEPEYLNGWFSGWFLGRIAVYGKMEIFIKSKEQGHNEPHIHVKYQNIEASFSFLSGEMLAGKLPTKNQRLIKDWVLINAVEQNRCAVATEGESERRGTGATVLPLCSTHYPIQQGTRDRL